MIYHLLLFLELTLNPQEMTEFFKDLKEEDSQVRVLIEKNLESIVKNDQDGSYVIKFRFKT